MSTKAYEVVTNPHDQFFRKAMEDKRVATEFLKVHLPADLCARIDFNTLTLQPRSQANAVRKESIVDVLFKTKIDGVEAYIYLLLEHQSTPDPLMSFRVIEYTVNAIRDHLKQYKTTKIPLIYPLVVYHGRPYEFVRDIKDLVDAPRELVDRYFMEPFQLLDLNKISDEALKQNILSGIMTMTLKHIFAGDMLPFLQKLAPVMQKVYRDKDQDFVGIVLQYILESAELSDEQAFIELINANISDEMGGKVMTLAEQWLRRGEIKGKLEGILEGEIKGKLEGEIKGKLEGKLEVAKNLLEAGTDPVFVAKNTGLSLDRVKQLQKTIRQ